MTCFSVVAVHFPRYMSSGKLTLMLTLDEDALIKWDDPLFLVNTGGLKNCSFSIQKLAATLEVVLYYFIFLDQAIRKITQAIPVTDLLCVF